MRYSDWNILLCDHFFNQEESMVFLAIDKEELIDVALSSPKIQHEIGLIENKKGQPIDHRQYAWADYLRLFYDIKTKSQFLTAFQSRISETIAWNKLEDKRPTVFPFLCLIFISLSGESDLKASAFYKKVNTFLISNYFIGRNEKLNTPDFSHLVPSLEMMWFAISEWAFSNNFLFETKYKHSSAFQQYTEPFIAELLFPFNRREQLKTLFVKSGLTPDETLTEERIISLFSEKSYMLGIQRTKARKWIEDYKIALISEFSKLYSRWDGTARIEKRNDDSTRIDVSYEGSNYKLYLGFYEERNQMSFFLTPYVSNSESSDDYVFINQDDDSDEYSFFVRSSGFASKSYSNKANITRALSDFSKIVFYEEENADTKLIFNPLDLFLFERSGNNFLAKAEFSKGGNYFVLVKKDSLNRYEAWLDQNQASIYKSSLFEDSFLMYQIECASSSFEEDARLSFKKNRSISLVDTIVLNKENNICEIPSTFPAYFKIEGIDIVHDAIRAVSTDNRYSFPLIYDTDNQMWVLQPIANVFAKDKVYQIFCNDNALSYSKYRFTQFALPSSDQYQEIGFNHFGEYTAENPSILGLKILPESDVKLGVNLSFLQKNMLQFGAQNNFSPKPYVPNDYLLYSISTRPRVTKNDIKDYIRVMLTNKAITEDSTRNKYQVNAILEYYFSMGYLNYTYQEGKHLIAVNKPTILWLPPSFKVAQGRFKSINCTERQFKFLLTGARTPAFIDKVINICKTHHISVEILESENKLLPQKIILWADDLDSISKLAELGKIEFQKCIYANALLRRIGSVEDYEKAHTSHISDLFYDGVQRFRKIDYKKLSAAFMSKGAYISNKNVTSNDINVQSDVVTYFSGTPDEETIYWKDGSQYSVDKYWGHLIGSANSNSQIIFFDDESCSLMMPSQIRLPLIYLRTLSMINAEPQDSSRGYNSLTLNLNPFADKMDPKEILSKLSQTNE